MPEREIDVNLQIALYCIVAVISFVSNILIIIVILRKKSMRTKSNLLLVNLALTDLCIITVGIPPTIVNLSSDKPHSETNGALCDFAGILILMAFLGSNFNLTLIAIHRYVLIARNKQYNAIFSNKKIIAAIISIWITALLIGSPPLFGWGNFEYNFGRAHCMIEWSYSISYLVFMQIVAYVIPLVALIFSYYKVIRVTKNSQKRLKASSESHKSKKYLRQHKLTLMLIVVVISFFSFFAPYAVMLQREGLFKKKSSELFSFLAMFFAYCNSIVDFWIYSIMSTKFRKALLEFLSSLTGNCATEDMTQSTQASSSADESTRKAVECYQTFSKSTTSCAEKSVSPREAELKSLSHDEASTRGIHVNLCPM